MAERLMLTARSAAPARNGGRSAVCQASAPFILAAARHMNLR